MKKLLTMVLATGLLTVSAFAQDAPSKEDKAKAKAQKEQALTDAVKELELTKDIEGKLKGILEEASEKSKALKGDASLTDAQKAEKKEAINAEKNAKLKELLGDEKYKKWTAIRKKQKDAAPAAMPK